MLYIIVGLTAFVGGYFTCALYHWATFASKFHQLGADIMSEFQKLKAKA